MVVGFVIAACGAAQVVDDRREAPVRQEQVVLRLATLVQAFQHHARAGGRFVDPEALLRRIDDLGIERVLDSPTRADLIVLRRVARNRGGPIHEPDIPFEFEQRLTRMFKQVHRKYVIERSKLLQLRRGARNRGRKG